MPQSLSSWCKENNLAKGTVHAKAKGLDIDTSKGLSDDAINQLSEAFNLSSSTTVSQTEILTGNHRTVSKLALSPTSIDLGNLRGNSQLTIINNDALSAVDNALTMADQLMDAMDSDIDFQTDQLQRTQTANNQLRRKAEALRRKQDSYAIKSQLIGLSQGKEAIELQQTMQELQNLGNQD
jgi:hypothetical protein